jgi:hypothetical protein
LRMSRRWLPIGRLRAQSANRKHNTESHNTDAKGPWLRHNPHSLIQPITA